MTANAGDAIAPLARRPGARKGMPRPPGAGRKKGTPNRSTAEIKTVAQRHGPKAIARAVQLLRSDDPRVALAALREILDRGYGKPQESRELTGPDGAPLYPPREDLSDEEAARRLAYVLSKADRAPHPAPRHDPTPAPAPAPAAPPAEPPAETSGVVLPFEPPQAPEPAPPTAPERSAAVRRILARKDREQ